MGKYHHARSRGKNNSGINLVVKKIQEQYTAEQEKILNSYTIKFERLVKNWLSQNGLVFEAPGAGVYLEERYSMQTKDNYWVRRADKDIVYRTKGTKYANGVEGDVFNSEKYGNKYKSIRVKNYSKPKPPKWDYSGDINEEGILTKWIVGDGKLSRIHPMPPWGTWFPKELWTNLYYKAYPYFDEIKKTPEFLKLKTELAEELGKVYTDIVTKEATKYQAQRKAGHNKFTWSKGSYYDKKTGKITIVSE